MLENTKKSLAALAVVVGSGPPMVLAEDKAEARHLAHLFDRFYRVDSSRSHTQGSTGLGLAIVRSIMSLHQGEAQGESVPGAMTAFTLVFPDNQPPTF